MLMYGLYLSLAALSAEAQQPDPDRQMPERGLCAHRGCMDTHPENTIPAFEEAVRLGAQMIEFDIQLTRDSAMVIMHDATVDRTTDGTGRVSDLTFEEIRRLDAGSKKESRFKGTRVPTFAEVLGMMPYNVWLNCHLKGDEAEGRAAAALLAESGRLHQAFLTCSERAAKAAREAVPGILICNAESSYRKDTPRYVAETVKMKADFIQLLRPEPGEDRKEQMKILKENGVKVNFFYAASPDELSALFKQGVDFPLVNNPGAFVEEARENGILPVTPAFKK